MIDQRRMNSAFSTWTRLLRQTYTDSVSDAQSFEVTKPEGKKISASELLCHSLQMMHQVIDE